MKHFIHHPASTRIDVRVSTRPEASTQARCSTGGLAFLSGKKISPGTLVTIKIPYPRIKAKFIIKGKVAWCRKQGQQSALGIEFQNTDDAFAVRMFEQICHIDDYRKAIRRNEGRNLSAKDAAQEWISKYSATFPNPDAEPVHCGSCH